MSYFPSYLLPSFVQSGQAIRLVDLQTKESKSQDPDEARNACYRKLGLASYELFDSPYGNPSTRSAANFLFYSSIFLGMIPESVPCMKEVHQVAKVASAITPAALVAHALALVVFKKSIPHIAFLAFFALHTAFSKGFCPEFAKKPYEAFTDTASVASDLAHPNTVIKIIGVVRGLNTLAYYGWINPIPVLAAIK